MKVSTIIPNYNRATLVKETIDNMLQQTWEDHEIIVVDDGSTDNSVEILKAYGDRIKVICQKNQGVGAARNNGLEVANGEYIQFMDSDDLAGPRKVENQVIALEDHRADVIYGPWVKLEIHGKQIHSPDLVLQQKPLPGGRMPIEWHASHWSTVLQSCMFRKSIFDKVGLFRTDWKVAEDQDLFSRCVLFGGKLTFTSDCITLYRLHESDKLTTTGTTSRIRILNWASYLLETRKHLLQTIYRKDPLKWKGYRNRLREAIWHLKKFEDEEVLRVRRKIEDLLVGYNEIKILPNSHLARIYYGLRFRLTGSRYHPCFQTGPFTAFQLKEIEELGFQLL
ncbi:MAG: glycosyltransferase [Verrucomicrobiae bacterium]|nr:glycosyltransferase [Verrucomicrobiae bacterium]